MKCKVLAGSMLDRRPNLETWGRTCSNRPLLRLPTRATGDSARPHMHVSLPGLPARRSQADLIGASSVKPPIPQSNHVRSNRPVRRVAHGSGGNMIIVQATRSIYQYADATINL
jgi:hypothetical protein